MKLSEVEFYDGSKWRIFETSLKFPRHGHLSFKYTENTGNLIANIAKSTNRRRLRLRLCRLISWKYFENIFALNHVSKMIAWSGLVFARGWLIEIMQSENFVKKLGVDKIGIKE